MTDTPEFAEVDEPVGNETAAGPPSSGYHYSHDHIADRTGELLSSAVETAREFPLVKIGSLADPRDGTVAHVIIGADRAIRLDPNVFDAYRTNPLYIEGTAQLTTLDSFIDHTQRFQLDKSAVFACDDMVKPSLTTVFDYHPEGEDELARNCAHKAHYAFPLSPEWKAWKGHDGTWMPMDAFAAFLEDQIIDVMADPAVESYTGKAFIQAIGGKMASPSKLIELARGLQVYESAVVKEARNLSSGEGQLTFESTHLDADGKPLVVPNLFAIAIPIFARSPVFYQFLVRLRYRKSQGGIVFAYEIWRPELPFEQAFAEACQRVKAETSLPLFVGAPEA